VISGVVWTWSYYRSFWPLLVNKQVIMQIWSALWGGQQPQQLVVWYVIACLFFWLTCLVVNSKLSGVYRYIFWFCAKLIVLSISCLVWGDPVWYTTVTYYTPAFVSCTTKLVWYTTKLVRCTTQHGWYTTKLVWYTTKLVWYTTALEYSLSGVWISTDLIWSGLVYNFWKTTSLVFWTSYQEYTSSGIMLGWSGLWYFLSGVQLVW